MLGSVVLDVAIGMVFVFLLLSLIASAIQELLATIVQARSANLYRGLLSLFSGGSVGGITYVEKLYNHGLIQGLYRGAGDFGFPIKPGWLSSLRQRFSKLRHLKAAAEEPDAPRLVRRSPLAWLMRVARLPHLPGVNDLRVLPSYIPARTFAMALVDLLNPDKATGADAAKSVKNTLLAASKDDPDSKAIQALLALSVDAGDDLNKLQTNLANWYNDAMDRVSGWYKKNTQYVLLGIGVILAIVFNVNSIQVAQTLWFDRDVRQSMVDAASKMQQSASEPARQAVGNSTPASGSAAAAAPCPQGGAASGAKPGAAGASTVTPPGAFDPCYFQVLRNRLNDNIAAFHAVSEPLLPVGWNHDFPVKTHGKLSERIGQLWVQRSLLLPIIVGWLVTAIAISFGAPFWFDTLNKIMVVRGTVKPQEKSQTEASKDATSGATAAGGTASKS